MVRHQPSATDTDIAMHLALSNHGLRNSGGIERYALTLVRGLHARGIKPVFAAKAFDKSLPEYGWVDPVPVRMSGVPGKLRDFWFDWRLRSLKRQGRWAPLIACNQTGAADIAICGSNHPAYLEAMGQRPGHIDRWKIALERDHLTNAKLIVAHSRGLAQQVQQHYGVAPGKIEVLYPPIDGDRFSTVPDARRLQLRESLGLPDDRAVFLLASTGHRRKGLDLLLDFFQTTRLPVLLAVAGRPIDAQGPNLRYLGYRTDIEDVFCAVDFSVMASRYEPFGLVGIESVLCGTPVLLADNVGCAEVIAEPATLGFSLTQSGSLAQAVEQAVARWQAGEHRLVTPCANLRYDPSVSVHLDALLAWAQRLAPGP
jgi:glycosyltransferase involved in cell wall biosynthesis